MNAPSPLAARTPRHRSSRTAHRLLCAALSAALLVTPTVGAFAQATLPALGDTESDDLGLGAERRLGDQIMREIRVDPDYIDDPLLLEYVRSLFDPLVVAARKRGEIHADIDQRFAWEPFLVRDRSVNAFALPGGYMGIHLGLIAVTATRDELASVLGHEMAHVTQRHIARSIGNSKRMNLLTAAATIAGVLAATRSGGGQAAQALIMGGQAAGIQGQLNFSRDMEREADRIGFTIMSGAGFAPGGMAAMFEKMEKASQLNDSGNFPYLRSHPLTAERIGEARSRLGSAPATPLVSVLEHSAAQARARVLMDTRVVSLRRWQAVEAPASAPASERLLAAYSSAFASSLLRDWAQADASLQRAIALVQGIPLRDARADRAVRLLEAQSMLERGDAAKAAQSLQPLLGDGSRPVQLMAAQIALAANGGQGDATAMRRSADELQTRVSTSPNDATAWLTLSQLWGRGGQRLRALRAEAESRVALGDMAGAIERLRAGQRIAREGGASTDFVEASVIDARLRSLDAQRRQQMEDEKRGGHG